jgi:hypothetical protein
VEEGALYYFNKHASELTLGEGAMLAGIIPSPNRMSPYHDADLALSRRNEVLADMVACGFISKAEGDRARRTPLRFAPNPAPSTRAPYFVDYVREVLSKDIPEADLSTRGLRVFTTLDPRLEDAAERCIREGARDADLRSPTGASRVPSQGALIAIEPQNGAIRAGGRLTIGPSLQSGRGIAGGGPGPRSGRSPGVAALDTPFSGRRPPPTAATVLGTCRTFPPRTYAPRNYENSYWASHRGTALARCSTWPRCAGSAGNAQGGGDGARAGHREQDPWSRPWRWAPTR